MNNTQKTILRIRDKYRKAPMKTRKLIGQVMAGERKRQWSITDDQWSISVEIPAEFLWTIG